MLAELINIQSNQGGDVDYILCGRATSLRSYYPRFLLVRSAQSRAIQGEKSWTTIIRDILPFDKTEQDNSLFPLCDERVECAKLRWYARLIDFFTCLPHIQNTD